MLELKRGTDANITSAPFSDGRMAVAYDKSKVTFDFLINNEEKRVVIDGRGSNNIILSSVTPIGGNYKENDIWFEVEEITPSPSTYTITYKANGGVGNDIIETKTENVDYIILGNSFTPPINKEFIKWNTSADGSGTSYNTDDIYTIDTDLTLYAIWNVVALKFSSDGDFVLSTSDRFWGGTLQYSTDNGNNWSTWDGSQLSGTASQPVYLRGINNAQIAGDNCIGWTFTGKYCTGNIETLLDYQAVINGQHPTMNDNGCFANMFYGCSSLITPPELPATTLAENCYYGMFKGCISLTTAPELPATILVKGCYHAMFDGCTSLTVAPSLPATILAVNCYAYMFRNCTSLTTAPQLPATTLAEGCYYYMFYGCTFIKLSTSKTGIYQYEYRIPTSSTGITATSALTDMFTNTGGTFTGTPSLNTIYYTDHQPI